MCLLTRSNPPCTRACPATYERECVRPWVTALGRAHPGCACLQQNDSGDDNDRIRNRDRGIVVPDVAEIRARRPQQVKTARLLAILAAVLWMPILGHLDPAAGALALVFYVFGAFGVAKGRSAGRIMATAALVVVYVLVLPYCVVGFADPYLNGPAYAAIDIVAVLVSGAGMWLTYRPRTNSYLNEVTAAMNTAQQGR